MDIKQTLKDTAKSAKFDGLSIHVAATPESRLQLKVEMAGSVDLPGDRDQVVAQIAGLLGVGNSLPSSQPSSP